MKLFESIDSVLNQNMNASENSDKISIQNTKTCRLKILKLSKASMKLCLKLQKISKGLMKIKFKIRTISEGLMMFRLKI